MKIPSSKAGFTLVEIMIVVAIIGLLAAIAIPNFVRARATSQLNACLYNLRQIDAASQQWGLENNAPASAAVTKADILPYLGRGGSGSLTSAFCPTDTARSFDTSYTLSTIDAKPVCQKVPGTTVGVSHFIN